MRTELTLWLPECDRTDDRLDLIVEFARDLFPGVVAASETTS